MDASYAGKVPEKMMDAGEIKTVVQTLLRSIQKNKDLDEKGSYQLLYCLATWQIAAELDEIRYLLRQEFSRDRG